MNSDVAHAHDSDPDRLNPTVAPPGARIARGAAQAIAIACITLLELPRPGGAAESTAIVFEQVNVVAMDAPNSVLTAQNVYVTGNTISAVRASANDVIPDHARRIEGRGYYLMPGLADMHAHIAFGFDREGVIANADEPGAESQARDELLLFVINGITTVRNMSGTPLHLRLAREQERGELLGPHLVVVSPIVDGTPPSWPSNVVATDAQRARELVRRYKNDGYRFIKIYHNLTLPVYDALIDEAHTQGIPVVGHVPFRVGLPHVLESGQLSIEHLRGYDLDPSAPPPSTLVERFSGFLHVSSELLAQYVRETVAVRAWNCPTLALQVDGAVPEAARRALVQRPEMQLLPPHLRQRMIDDRFYVSMPPEVLEAIRQSVPNELRLLRELWTHGANLMAGTDAPLLMSIPGYSLHRELEVMHEAGLDNFAVLRSATADPARFLNEKCGMIAPGNRADLLLLDQDPLKDIRHTRAIRGVMLNGRWLDRPALDALVEQLRER